MIKWLTADVKVPRWWFLLVWFGIIVRILISLIERFAL